MNQIKLGGSSNQIFLGTLLSVLSGHEFWPTIRRLVPFPEHETSHGQCSAQTTQRHIKPLQEDRAAIVTMNRCSQCSIYLLPPYCHGSFPCPSSTMCSYRLPCYSSANNSKCVLWSYYYPLLILSRTLLCNCINIYF